ncbi:centrosome-associated protein 350 isoform X2 [Myotis myotis]|uniref:centrosome-associated protein 350 isoform X2 n=1 Tax=Myotis myotis TaxID=51298 RepID=UPI00174A4F89|nr:centrosome-associated protein 350 isoform X2 [Myotis myotis]XP_036200384.1 centrosome-associated protein 350 isoform X2 [Myotis myotis]
MRSSKSKEVPLPNPRNSQSKDTVQDITTSWDAHSQTKAALRHIENKLEVTPTSTAVFDSVMDTKKSSASATRKISRKDGRYLDDTWLNAPTSKSSKSRKEKSRSPLRVTTLESNVKKNNRVEFREPLASYREVHGTPSNISPNPLESKHVYCVDVNEEKPENGNWRVSSREERNTHCSDFESSQSSVMNDTVVRFLNDRPAIDALQNSESLIKMAAPMRTEEEKPNRTKGNENNLKASGNNIGHDIDPKVLRLTDSSPSSTSTSNSQRLDILKRRQHDVKLEKLKERIRKQWEHSEEINGRSQNQGHIDHPVMVVNVDSSVTAKVRKVATAPPAPAYKGFNPSETKIRTPDGKVWQEAEFQNMSRELYRDLALHLAEDISMKEKPAEKSKEKKVVKPVRKVQKVAQFSSPECKTGSSHLISTSSWRDGQKLVKKILGPAPKMEQKERRTVSSDRSGRERTTKSGSHVGRAESDPRLNISHRHLPRNSERSRSRARSENNIKKLARSLPDNKQEENTALNKDFLPVEIRGILDDLQLDSATRQEAGDLQNQKSSAPVQAWRSHSPIKRKPDKITANEDPPVISKKRHYDTDEVRQYIVKQQEERKRKQNEEKKAQKEATEQKNKRLQELYRKQKEAFTKVKNVPPSEPSATRRLQETYSKLLLEKTLLEEPTHQHTMQEIQTRPGYQPSGESDKENKVQERPPSASSSSDMSLSEPPQPLARRDLTEPTWMPPDRLSPRVHHSQPQPLVGTAGNLLSHLLSLEHAGFLHKDLESILPTRKNHNTASGPLTFTPQPYLTSPAAHQDALLKPSASQYKSKLDRIEALKATAASLSSRIENEAKKLAGANINYGSVWNTEYDVQQTPQEDGPWTKVISPPVKEDTEDVFAARIQKMLGTCVSHATFDDELPGVGNLSEFKKLPEVIRPHSAISSFRMRSPAPKPEGLLAQLCKKQTDSSSSDLQPCSQFKAKTSLGSSTDSVSEGPLLSEGSLSEEEGGRDGRPSLKIAEILKEKEFCAGERNAYEPIKQFQKEAEKFLPLLGHIGGTQSKEPWEELAKGSPRSVINIFTKSYQSYGKEFEDRFKRGASASQPLNASTTPLSSVSYEDDFVSSPGSGTLTEKKSALEPSIGGSNLGTKEDHSSRKSAYDLSSVDVTSQHSSGTQSAASSCSSTSSKGRKGKKEKIEWLDSLTGNVQSSLLDEEKVHSVSERDSHQEKKSETSSKLSVKDYEQTLDTDSTLKDLSGHSVSVSTDKGRSQKTPASPLSPSSQKLLQFDLPGTSLERSKSSVIMPPTIAGFKPSAAFPDMNMAASRATTEMMTSTPGSKRFSPAGLQHRMAAELSYLSAIEESVRQLSDVERVRGISLAQQESVSLAQIIKAQQQRHERDLALLKLKAEQETLECQRQLEETRNKAAQVHAESLQQVVKSQRDVTEVLQEATCKIAAQQTETARLTTDAARQICEMAELTRTHISDAITASGAPLPTLYDHQRTHASDFVKQLRTRAETDRKSQSVSLSHNNEGTPDSKHQKYSSYDSYSESSRYKNHDRRSSSGSSRQESPSVPSSKENEKKLHGGKTESSIDEQVQTAADDSLQSDSVPSLPDEKDSASIVTEYSLKFDESMTEDEIEEKSFRSLLPSESHRRFNLEKRRNHHDDSDEETSPEKTTLSSAKELSMPFSGGQDSFSKFTMEMVRQYMKEEEMRAAHQSSLLRLREKALKEKTKAELAWLEHQKKHLRDKGEDDKMPPLRKKQRGLLLKLQQEKAEIKRLQEANKAARKERQLILKQQEEIERIRQTTIKLQEKLKSAGENKLDSHSDDDTKDNKAISPGPTDLETRSPSPISISSSETSSIMQKLKKMRSRMDEKHCSPVHYFFSVFTSHHWASLSVCFPNLHPKFQLYIYNQLVRFLTKREQKLMQRRQHAEELLEWKRRLDAEEAEIRQMEKQALAAWDKELIKPKTPKKELEDQRLEQKEIASEAESPVLSYSHLHSESSIPEELGSSAVEYRPSESIVQKQPGSPDHSILTEDMVFSQELESSTSPSKHSPPKSCTSVSKLESSKGSYKIGGQCRPPVKSHQPSYSWSDESISMTQSETTSDQSDIEGRIRALKDELRKRKSVVDQLKKEQKKRQKERLKAQEASLIKQLESYDEFIKKTEAELSRDLETSPTAKPQIKTLSSASEKPKIKPLPLHRSETAKNWKSLTDSERSRGSLESIAEHVDAALAGSERSVSERSLSAYARRVIELDSRIEEHFQTSSPILRSSRKIGAESGDSIENIPSLPPPKELNAPNRILDVPGAKVEEEASQNSEIQEVKYAELEESTVEEAYFKQSRKSDVLLKLDLEQGDSSEILSRKDLSLDAVNVQKDLVSLAIEDLDKKELRERQSDQDMDHSQNIQSERGILQQKNIKERDLSLSEHLLAPKEISYSEDFEVSSVKKDISAELCKGNFEVTSLLSLRRDTQSCRDRLQPTRSSKSEANSFGTDGEISECLSEKSLSIHSNIHSERLLELKSPTELMKSKERSDVEHEQGVTECSSLTSVPVADELLDFHIGDRVLIGNVQPGTLRFKGVTSFAKGFWAGVELDKPEGNNNGTYDGIVYFVCKEKHGIFAPPQKISQIPENFEDYVDINEEEDCYSDEQYQYNNQEQKDAEGPTFDREKDAVEYLYEKSLPGVHNIEASVDRSLKIETDHLQDISEVLEAHVHQQSPVDSLISSKENKDLVSGATEDVSIAVEDDTLDNTFSEELKKQQQITEKDENLYPEVSEKLSTPLLDLLTREKNQLEAQLRSSVSEEKKSKQQLETVSLLTDSLLKVFVTDTVSQLQQIKKARNEKIHLSNQEFLDDQKKVPPQGLSPNLEEQSPSVPGDFLRSELDDEKEEISSPDMCPRPESPVFGASGQEELAKRLAELEISREFLSALGDDQDWFDEDFGLSSSHKIQKNKAEEAIVPLMAEPKRPPQKPCDTLLAVPHTAEEVEVLVHSAAEELWKWKELGHDLHSISIPAKLLGCASKGLDIESTSKRVYKQAVFDLTKEIFEEIFAEDPNLNQPVWMKPCRINSNYFRRVKNPNNLDEIKNFIATEVLKLFSFKKEPNHKTDWQKMMKFGRKKRDRVDHILVQELHEEEAQWVNYDEDELCVKMQLADGIFETLIRDTIDVLNQISEKQGRVLLV